MEGIVSEVVGTSIKLYALMTPPAVLSAFISGTKEYDKKRKVTVAFKTSTAIFIIGVVLYLFGSNLFELFGFTLDAFRIGSGVLLMLTAVALMNDDGSQVHAKREGDISVVPLAIPLGMGPASIGAVMVMGASAEDLHEMLVGVFSLLLAAAGMFLLLCLADGVARVLRRTGIAVLSKLTGLLLAAIAAQVIFTGVSAFLK
ncbi:MAG: MarC family protein [Desulfovibrio sp.]|uniref:MarC family protein n=1 Tax=Desulfovibrio sp. TaxID=885 RepID=UPI0025C347FE|nr:MarC family protein [Desulfovibrio sp.]MBS6829032.1 MarC family protein [Desulfovibrio sp.]